ncbi:MAG TPA: hypothetical protein VMT46_13915 [Anaerolineaceae bacterium]|nr:hypothetical protein [Anaerolineaceae bacterium]
MNAYDPLGRPIRLSESIGRGGEASVYRIANERAQIAKIYEPAPRPGYSEKLTWMTEHPPLDPTLSAGHPSLAWPGGLLYDLQGRFIGYRMPYIYPAVPLLHVFNPKLRKAILPRFDRRYLHRVARNLSSAVAALHTHGYVAGDLNESNVLVIPSALVTLIDADSFQVEEQRDGNRVIHFCPVGKFEYLPPEMQANNLGKVRRLPEQDNFALAVLIFQLLMEGNHPFRAQWLGEGEPPPIEARIAEGAFPYTSANQAVIPPRNAPDLNRLHPAIVELTRRCFVDGHLDPGLRPDARTWEEAIIQAERALRVCPNGHIYSAHFPRCPDCPAPAWSAWRPAETAARPGGPAAAKAAPVPPPRSDPQPAQQARPQPAAAAAQVPNFFRPAPANPQVQGTIQASPNFPLPSVPRPITMNIRWQGPKQRPGSLFQWAAPRVAKSFLIGGGLGALAGLVPGAAIAAASKGIGDAVAWSLLFALGGAAGGLLRGWEPGYRIGDWLDRHMGWTMLWQGAGMVLGAILGLMLGMVFWWAVFPIVLGVILGARVGAAAGRWIWQAGNRFGWGRIFAVLGGGIAAGLGWMFAGWAASGGLGDSISGWIAGGTASLVWTWALAGALCGGLGGAIGGSLADLFGRLSGLVR